ncbi:DUF5313 family protein [Pseudonocardia abyssalis]|uniref:DUF5313 family protein n=1 Tax=Pseudonocardia abyssalis TaxID=2792008 RepID=A0ABS6UY84_9PSEU|nr:DUF5313 family protein [Pseudonocardia abyssalis]MBW0115409.1 DUF5313 family protein [Pseudonocardia abyssalis]MBW0136843.1 DUF5313 family protein [Pseudonocardia abyssalis]
MIGEPNIAPERPGPFRWIAYAHGSGLPQRHRSWVLHDVTTRTWAVRHLVRTAVQLAPVLLVLYLLLPGEPWARGAAVLAGALLGFFYSGAYLYESAEHRAIKAGYPRGRAGEVRGAARGDDAARAQRYRQRWRT